MPQTLVILLGPPAVGKMTVGRELSALTGLPLFHNHLSIEAVLPVFGFGTPPFNRLVRNFRERMFAEVAGSDLPGLIFTFVWAFDQPSDRQFIDELKATFELRGGRTVFVELWASVETRLERNAHPDRLAAKVSKRDLAASNERLVEFDRTYQLSSGGEFPFAEYLHLDNSTMEPAEAARAIAVHFGLETVQA